MKLLIKILLFALVALVVNVKITSAAIIFQDFQKTTISTSFHKDTPEMVFKVIENDLANCCQNEEDLVHYRERGKVIETVAAKGVGKGTHLVYEGLDAAGNVKYIGITGRDAAVRFGEHLNSGTARSLLDYRVINGATGLSKTQAKFGSRR
jgi:hypothetical protein